MIILVSALISDGCMAVVIVRALITPTRPKFANLAEDKERLYG